MEPTLADAAATFRVTTDLACSLATDSHPAKARMVNSVGDILRHEKLRRLEKVFEFLHREDLSTFAFLSSSS